ncbi:hypothetical protein K1719_022546 [Acacia pycnantha]|nr:hypothetical protein K1719_022546 [Acacia pycnantha]
MQSFPVHFHVLGIASKELDRSNYHKMDNCSFGNMMQRELKIVEEESWGWRIWVGSCSWAEEEDPPCNCLDLRMLMYNFDRFIVSQLFGLSHSEAQFELCAQ